MQCVSLNIAYVPSADLCLFEKNRYVSFSYQKNAKTFDNV